MRLAHGESPDRVPGEIELKKLPRAFAAQIAKCGALDDSELPLGQLSVAVCLFLKIGTCPPGPLGCAHNGRFCFVARSGRLDAFIENHGYVRT